MINNSKSYAMEIGGGGDGAAMGGLTIGGLKVVAERGEGGGLGFTPNFLIFKSTY